MMIRWKASWIAILLSAGIATAQQQQDVPTEADLAAITDDKPQFIDRLLSVIEKEIAQDRFWQHRRRFEVRNR